MKRSDCRSDVRRNGPTTAPLKLALVCVSAVLVGGSASGTGRSTDACPQAFDQALWRSASELPAPDNPRLGMLRSVECRLHIGMAQEAVLSLLGPPDTRLSANAVAYALGVSPYGIDYEELVIEFDENGRLARHYWRRL